MKVRPPAPPPPPGSWRGLWLVCARELAAAIDSPIAATTLIAFSLVASSLYMNEFFLIGQLEMSSFFERLPLLFTLFLPALSMRSWSEERATRTFELLVSLPLSPLTLVLGKWLATLALLTAALLGSLPIVLMLVALGSPDLLWILSGYLGAFLLGAWLLAIGGLFSALARDQVVAFVSTAFFAFLALASGDARVVAVIDGWAADALPGSWIADTLSALPHFERLLDGQVDSASLIYFGGGTLAALLASAWIVARDRA